MKLEEILNNRIKALYKNLKKTDKILSSTKSRLNSISDNIDLLDLFLEDAVHIENFRNIDTSQITDLLRDYNYIDSTGIESELNVIKVLLKGIYDRNLKTSLNEDQKELLESYIEKVTMLLNELSERKSELIEDHKSVSEIKDRLEDEILRIDLLRDKIRNKDDNTVLTLEDLDVIRLISEDEDEPIQNRKDVLIGFIEYNNDRKQGKSKENKVDLKDVIKCFNEYDINIIKTVNKYASEVESVAKIKNIKEVLKYMASVNIIGKFSYADLLTICLYGTKESVERGYAEVCRKEDDRLYYGIASAWVDNIENRKVKKKKYYAHEKGDKPNTTLSSLAHLISREEIDKNIEYLRSEGFEFDTEESGVRKTLTTNNYRIREAVNALKLYGIVTDENVFEFKVWLLAEPQIVEKIDRFVELGLLGGSEGHPEYANYVKRYPSKLHNMEYPLYLILYKVKQTYSSDAYYDAIASSKKGQLAGDLNSGKFTDPIDTPDEIEYYKLDNFVSPEDRIKNYSTYEDIINSSFDVEINKNILKLPEIQDLETNHRVDDNPYVYVFDNVIISRIKVLRNYSLINDGSKESLMASIVKGSFLTEDSYQKIAQSINYTLGGNNGLFKKIQSN